MGDILVALKDEFANTLNSSAFTSDSIEGWIIILVTLFLIYELSHKAVKFTGWLIGLIFFFQIGHWLSFTGLNDIIPLDVVFKYDVLTAVAQCFVGTRICDWLLYANSFIHIVCNGLWEKFVEVRPRLDAFGPLINGFRQ